MADINSGEMTKLEFSAIEPASSSGPVLSYAVTNDRGWNDPPSFAFSPNSTGNRKRIDPRKRVAHNISSTGNGYAMPAQIQSFQPIQTQQPTNQQPLAQPTTQQPQSQQPYTQNPQHQQSHNMMNGITQAFNNISVSPIPPIHHASSNPDLYQAPFLQPLHHSTSVPNQMNATGHNRIPGHGPGTMTPPPSGSNTPPVQTRSGSATPPCSNSYSPSRKLSVPTMPFGNSIFDQHSTPTMLQSSHLSSTNSVQKQATSSNYGITNGHQQMQSNVYSPLPSQQLTNQLYSPTQSAPGTFSPTPTQNTTQIRASPTNIPPPIAGYYSRRVSNGHTSPKVSPAHSGQSSPIPSIDPTLLENDQEVLANTLKQLNNCREQCMCRMTAKVSEDINKKIKLLESNWVSGRLSTPTKGKMVQLADALSQNDYTMSDRLHKSLLHEHSNEVSSWLVGIKKLLSCCQEGAIAPNQ